MSHCRKRLKVVYLIGSLNVGGSQQQIVDTFKGLNRDRFEPKLYTIFGGGSLLSAVEQDSLNVTVCPLKEGGLKRTRQFLSLFRYLKRERPDIVHCYMFKACLYGGFATTLAGNAVLLTSRRRLGSFKDKKPVYQMLENMVNHFADGVLVNSVAVKTDVLRRERLKGQKIHLVHNGVDIHQYAPLHGHHSEAGLETKRRFGIPETAPVVGMLANLFFHKGYREFITAAAHIHRQRPDVRFVCIGRDTGIHAQLERLVREYELQDDLVFTGEVHDIPSILQVLDVQVSASHEEGFSNAILEGMACGKPVVATRVGGTPEAVRQDVTGLLVPPKDSNALARAVLTLLDQPEFARQLGMNARKQIERYFTQEVMLRTLEQWYLERYEDKQRTQFLKRTNR